MEVRDIQVRLSRYSQATEENANSGNNLAELSLIGLVAYFEGFVRYHFASCANICPKLLARFARERPDTAILLGDIAELDTIHGKIGFLLADKLPFTTPKEINKQFRSLLEITPFTKQEMIEYDQILHDRHQIVHSAGMYTTTYLRTRRGGGSIPMGSDRPYLDSVVITPSHLLAVSDFVLGIAEKIVKASYARLKDPENWDSPEEMADMEDHLRFFQWTDAAFAPEAV